jgi:hypothetical protein
MRPTPPRPRTPLLGSVDAPRRRGAESGYQAPRQASSRRCRTSCSTHATPVVASRGAGEPCCSAWARASNISTFLVFAPILHQSRRRLSFRCACFFRARGNEINTATSVASQEANFRLFDLTCLNELCLRSSFDSPKGH